MASILVLVRHGKAEARNSSVPDFTRRLTPWGRRALAACLPDELLPLASMPEFTQGETQVWSSPALRALDTAEELACVLGVSEVRECACLLEQNFKTFMEEVRACEADVVAAVGHEPFTSLAAGALCGVELPFKTGAVGIFDLTEYSGAPEDTVLRCFAQGPRQQRWKTLLQMEEVVSQAAEKSKETLDAYLAAPEDVEAVHDFRVSIRTLRSHLGFLKPYLQSGQYKYLQSSLKQLVGRTSRLRELDVFCELLAESEHNNEELHNRVGKLRDRENKQLLSAIGTKKGRKKALRLFGQTQALQWREHIEQMGLSGDDVAERFDLQLLCFDAAYLKADYRDVEGTHDLRKMAKRLRYVSRYFGHVIGPGAEGIPSAMEEVQDELGALCDARVNCDIIDSLPRKKLSDGAVSALDAFRQQQVDDILAILSGVYAQDEAEEPLSRADARRAAVQMAPRWEKIDLSGICREDEARQAAQAGRSMQPLSRSEARRARVQMAPRWEKIDLSKLQA